MQLPENHPLRQELHNEVHARPPVPLRIPSRLSFLALLSEPINIPAEREHLAALCARYGAPPPQASANYYLGDLGAFRLKSERHAEFTRYTVITEGAPDDPFSDAPINLLPPEWIAGLKGRTLVSATVAVLPFPENLDYGELSGRHFSGNTLIGSTVGQGAAVALTDLRIQDDGSSRILIYDNHLTQRQAGRMVQRLLEIDTYRMMALLALPVAQRLNPFLAASERELAEITTLMHDGPREEPALLERLTKLQAAIEGRYADHHYRFSAAAAYYELVKRRIDELREQRLQDLQTVHEFMERRLAPAMNTCKNVSESIEALSERVPRSTNLLSTRVGMVRERQNQKLLEGMARRARLQLRLQQTVEGLSVAAISYYVVGLVGYAAKALKSGGLALEPDLAMGIAVPVVVALTALGMRRVRKRLHENGDES